MQRHKRFWWRLILRLSTSCDKQSTDQWEQREWEQVVSCPHHDISLGTGNTTRIGDKRFQRQQAYLLNGHVTRCARLCQATTRASCKGGLPRSTLNRTARVCMKTLRNKRLERCHRSRAHSRLTAQRSTSWPKTVSMR